MLDILTFRFVWMAVICSLMLAGVHAYLGFHIVSRGVIFVDLSLAQVAAFGAVFALQLGIGEGSVWQYVVSLGFTFLGAWIVSISRMRDGRVPQEAFIGIIYAGAAALTILVLAHQPGGMEELQHMLAGSLLTVTPRELVVLGSAYALIGLLHYFLRARFFLMTEDREAAARKGWNTTWWDFVFYATFGVVVTTAVTVAGVFLVFSLLVIPPVIALLFATSSTARLVVGWLIAFVGCVGGIFGSVALDLPTGPSIITFLVGILIVVAITRRVRSHSGK